MAFAENPSRVKVVIPITGPLCRAQQAVWWLWEWVVTSASPTFCLVLQSWRAHVLSTLRAWIGFPHLCLPPFLPWTSYHLDALHQRAKEARTSLCLQIASCFILEHPWMFWAGVSDMVPGLGINENKDKDSSLLGSLFSKQSLEMMVVTTTDTPISHTPGS